MSTLHLFNLRKESRVLTRVINRRAVEVMPKPDLTTQRLVFRQLMPNDEPAFIEAFKRSRPALRRWFPVNKHSESDHHLFERTMTKARMELIAGETWRKAAFLEDGRFVGVFNLIHIERGLEWSCEANWWVDSLFAGQGFGTEAVQGIIEYALADHPIGLGLHSVRAQICADNLASVRLAQKCGFVKNGQRHLLEINKALINHDEYELLASSGR